MTPIINYELTGTGWSKCTVRPARKSYTFNATYDSDVLGSLVIAAVSLLSDITTISFEFFGNYGTWIWVMERQSGEGVVVEIFESTPRLSGEISECDVKTVVKFICTEIAFAESVNASALAILKKHGIKGYAELSFNYGYPKELQIYLSKLIALQKSGA